MTSPAPSASAAAVDPVALEVLPDPVFVLDREQLIVGVNELGCRLLETPRDELLACPARKVLRLRTDTGADWWEVAAPFDADPRLLPRIPEQELTLVAKGRSRPVALTALRLPAEEAAATATLVVAVRRAEARRRRDAARSDLVSTVSHELRSPLTSVKGFTKTLLAKWERFTDDQKRQMLATVNEDADRVTRLLGELLDVSRIDAGRLQLKRQMTDVAAVAGRVVERLLVADRAGRTVALEVPDHVPQLYVDPDKVEQVWTNLLENALKYTSGAVTVSAEVLPDAVRWTVADEGDGIDPRDLGSIFTKFFRRPGERAHGTGLGLYISKGLVEAHGGEMWAESAPGAGSRFWFSLPRGGLELAGIGLDAFTRR